MTTAVPSHRSERLALTAVLEGGYCIGCGACASVDRNIAVQFDSGGRLQAALPPDVQLVDGIAAVCPFSGHGPNEDEIAAGLFEGLKDDRVGYFSGVFVAHVRDRVQRASGSSGGIGTWILRKLLESGMVDAIIHVRPAQEGSRLFEYAISRGAEELGEGGGSHYYPMEMSAVMRHVRRTPARYAFVGVPCFIKAARLLCLQDAVLKKSLVVMVGLVCGHLKSAHFAEMLAWEAGVAPGALEAIRFRVKLRGLSANDYGVRIHGHARQGTVDRVVPKRLSVVSNWGYGLFKYNACEYCDDVFAETADITVGDAWIDPYVRDARGHSLVVTRSSRLREMLESGRQAGEVVLQPIGPDEAALSQAGGLRHRRAGLAYRLFLKDAAGVWRPPKRVHARVDHLALGERERFDVRAALMHTSESAFAEAVRRRDIATFHRRVAPLIARYERLSTTPVRRAMRKLRDGLRWLALRLRPPQPL